MLGTKLLLTLLPLLALVNAQNTGWRNVRPFSRFPPRFIPRPVYAPPRPVQTVATTLPPPVTAPATTPRIDITTEAKPREIYPSTRSPLIPSSFAPPQRVPSYFRPKPFSERRPIPSLPSSTAPSAQKSTVIVLPGDYSVPNTPKPSFSIVYPESYRRPTPEGVPLAHESEYISQASSTPKSESGWPQVQPSFESRPQTQMQPQGAQAAQPQPEIIPIPNAQSQPEVVPTPQPQPEAESENPQRRINQPEIIEPQIQPSPQPQPGTVIPQIQPSPQPQPQIIEPQIQPSPQSQPGTVIPQIQPSPQPQPQIIEPQTQPSQPQPEIVEPQIQPSPQPQPQIVEPQIQPSPQPQPEIVVPQIQASPQTQPQIGEPQIQPSPQLQSEIQPSPQLQPKEPETIHQPQSESGLGWSSQPEPRSVVQQEHPRFLLSPTWTKPSWSKPSTIPNHPYPWMPTTAKPLSLPSRITTSKSKEILNIPTVIPAPKFPSHSAQISGLMDYQCAQPNGYYPVPNQCDTFIECKENTAMQIVCPDGLHFNHNAVWPEYPCDYPSRVSCAANVNKQEPEPTADCPRQYGYFPSISGDCGKYIMCQEGKATAMSCPAGLAFNSVTSTCDWPANVPSCNPDAFQGFTCPPPEVDKNGKPSDFIYKYRRDKSCKLYIACQRGSPRLLSCDDGFSYDDVTQSCVDSDLVTNCT